MFQYLRNIFCKKNKSWFQAAFIIVNCGHSYHLSPWTEVQFSWDCRVNIYLSPSSTQSSYALTGITNTTERHSVCHGWVARRLPRAKNWDKKRKSTILRKNHENPKESNCCQLYIQIEVQTRLWEWWKLWKLLGHRSVLSKTLKQ